ncbi:type IV pilus modification PilV family protein [Massilia agri]|uniref:Type IV pilus modification protein PilV n=1 Tax=Massilia agri TaxID=1886785 RepID=A0ABT2ANQ7_9BURK|nr:hypothetical protein [Massilia agri]MCS0597879.1 hypothetical protein [Massilia agri]
MTHPRSPFPMRARAQRGIAMLEALLAIVILAIGVIGTVGLQARSVSALADAGLRAEAAIAANKLLGVMNTDIANIGEYKVAAGAVPPARLAAWHAETTRLIPGASITVGVAAPVAVAAPSVVDIRISWRRKADTPLNTHRIVSYVAGAE